MGDNPVDIVISRLVQALFEIRDGAAFAVHLPESGHALTYEQIGELAAAAINWEQGMSFEDVLFAAFGEIDE